MKLTYDFDKKKQLKKAVIELEGTDEMAVILAAVDERLKEYKKYSNQDSFTKETIAIMENFMQSHKKELERWREKIDLANRRRF